MPEPFLALSLRMGCSWDSRDFMNEPSALCLGPWTREDKVTSDSYSGT